MSLKETNNFDSYLNMNSGHPWCCERSRISLLHNRVDGECNNDTITEVKIQLSDVVLENNIYT